MERVLRVGERVCDGHLVHNCVTRLSEATEHGDRRIAQHASMHHPLLFPFLAQFSFCRTRTLSLSRLQFPCLFSPVPSALPPILHSLSPCVPLTPACVSFLSSAPFHKQAQLAPSPACPVDNCGCKTSPTSALSLFFIYLVLSYHFSRSSLFSLFLDFTPAPCTAVLLSSPGKPQPPTN